ncbi:hypothetical protein [Halobacillus sp. A5]|uniref:hypothetical protein n=1 Tax=Halobacillus sp. A5 TaxID=2880263 RepID=UPI0020A6D75E|nr:hypothetical protein [Halobacillus sp. A5]MCP3027113.1 hypothetical protein [Halobacillus sp. A5]
MKRGAGWAAGVLLTVGITGSVISYQGYAEAKSDCGKNDGTVTEDNIDVLAMNWTVSCEK